MANPFSHGSFAFLRIELMKRPAKDADEQDCFFSRNAHKWLKRAKASAEIKKRHNRRERRKFNRELQTPNENDPREELDKFLKLYPRSD